MKQKNYTCFVIMPYGKKKVSGKLLNFDSVFKKLIEKAVEDVEDLNCVRCDDIMVSGSITKKMFTQIWDADVAVVDITSLNPNVFYELGIRHALKKSVTVLIRRKGTSIPFNITQQTVIEYSDDDLKSASGARARISELISNGLTGTACDSQVHDALDLRVTPKPKPIKSTAVLRYKVPGTSGKYIGLVPGNIQDVRCADVWVNSENTDMQMARHYDGSISSIIRYRGATKKKNKRVKKDTIALELKGVMGEEERVDAGQVIVTGPGELKSLNNVKMIIHAAAVEGQPGKGYRTINDIAQCVSNALIEADSNEHKQLKIKSILFPIMGTGTAKGSLEDLAREQIETAFTYLQSEPDTRLKHVFFLTWDKRQQQICQRILSKLNGKKSKSIQKKKKP